MKRIITLFITIAVAFSASVLPVSAECFSADSSPVLYLYAGKQKDYKYDHHYDIKVGDNTLITVELPKVKKLGCAVSDKSVMKIKKASYKDGTAKVILVGLKDGTSYLKVYDKKNKKRCSMIKITVLGEENEFNYEDKFESASDSSENYAEDVLEIVNYEREKAGLDALVLDDSLCKAADIRVKELGKHYGHDRPDGRSCFSVLTDENITGYFTAAENIAQGQRSPEAVMQSWMNSSGHKANILSPDFKKIGISYDPDTDSWVEIFIG